MPLKGALKIPTDQREWDQFTRSALVIPNDASVDTPQLVSKAVTNEALRDSAPASVIGRLASTPGIPGDISASVDDTFLVRRSGTLGFTNLADSDIPASIARDAEVTAALAAIAPLNGNVVFDPPSLADGAGTTMTVTVTGAALGDFALASFSLDLQGITVTAYISTANTVAVRFQNESGGTLDLASGILRIRVWRQ